MNVLEGLAAAFSGWQHPVTFWYWGKLHAPKRERPWQPKPEPTHKLMFIDPGEVYCMGKIIPAHHVPQRTRLVPRRQRRIFFKEARRAGA